MIRSLSQFSLLTLTLLLMTAGLNGQDGEDPPPKKNPLEGKQFHSIKKYEVGITPNGVALGFWAIQFKAGKFNWRYSDVGEAGTYQFIAEDNLVVGKSLGNRVINGKYNPKTKILTWDKIEYKEVEAGKK